MKILVDENVPTMCVQYLREAGHDVLDVRGTNEEGIPDEALWAKAQRESRLLITTDKGFARRRHLQHHGMLIVTLHRPNRHRISDRVIEAMRLFSPEDWPGLLVVMRETVMSTWRSTDT